MDFLAELRLILIAIWLIIVGLINIVPIILECIREVIMHLGGT